ncbi:MAG: Ig-like domain-containing protein [Gammaproteobacteria bacterium]|nr:Ig-like domain-containing protein [Gammaproteobacteria bacterium]
MKLNKKNLVMLVGSVLITGCLHEDASLEDLSSAPKAASFSIETDEDNVVDFQLAVTDREDNVTEYFLERQPSHGIISGDYPNLRYEPDPDYYGGDQFKYKVTDGSYDSNVATVSITINPVNDPPKIEGAPPTEVKAYKEYSFVPRASDIEDDALTFSINFLPSWAIFSDATGKLSGTPTNSDVGSIQNIVISVSDGTDDIDLASFPLDILPNPWVIRNSMPDGSAGGSAAYDNKIYLFGGRGSAHLNVSVYDPLQDIWYAKSPMPVGALSLEAHVLAGRIYIVVGSGLDGLKNDLLEYDPANDSWNVKAPRPTYRLGFSSSVVNGKIYVFGGYGITDDGPSRHGAGWNYKNHVEIYDPLTDSWSSGSPSPVVLAYNAGCVLNNKIYLLGGFTDTYSSTVYVYDPTADDWTLSQNMSIARDSPECVTLDGKIYVMGGSTEPNGTLLSTVELFDANAGTWLGVESMNFGRKSFLAETVSGKIYVFGGGGVPFG